MPTSPSRSGFTLVELLVVIAVIGILAGSLGLALRDGDRGAALQTAQSSLTSLLSAARAQAAASGKDATIVVWADPADPDTYLRRAAVMVNHGPDDAAGARWVQRGDAVQLPRGIFFVPENLGNGFPAKHEIAGDWANHRRTKSATASPLIVRLPDPSNPTNFDDKDPAYPAAGFDAYRTITINPQGRLKGKSGAPATLNNSLVIAIGELQPPDGVLFRNSDSMRGLFLSDYGIPTVVTEKAGLRN